MKKKRSSKSTIALASAIAALPLVGVPALSAQRPGVEKPLREIAPGAIMVKVPALKFSDRFSKVRQQYAIVGLDAGHTIYQNSRGEYFYLEPSTGDMQFLANDVFMKFTENAVRARPGLVVKMDKWSVEKFGSGITILGVDDAGHVVQQNPRGEKFYLDPATGDMVYVP